MKKALTAFVVLIGLLSLGGGVLTVSAIAQDGPLNVQVTDNTRTDAIRFTWDDNPAAGSGVINGVVILYRAKGASEFSKLSNVPNGLNEYMWYGAPPGLEYEFRLGYCGASDDFYLCDTPWVYLWTPGIFPGTRQLTTPTNFFASDGTVGNGISLNWDDHPQQSEANFRYQIWSSTSSGGTYVLGPGVFTSNHLDTTMDPLEHRYYKVYACIERCSGFAYDGGQRGLDKPENLIIDQDIDGVYLDWDWVQSADFYAVYRSPLEPVSWTKLGQTSLSAYTDLTGELNVEYQYRVKACSNTNGLCSAYTYGNGMRGITAPSLKATPANPFIQLSWKHTDLGETTEYRIWRAPKSAPLSRTLIAIQPLASGNSYLDTGADEGVEYIYQLKACENTTSLTCSNASTAVVKWNTCYQLTINVIGSGAVPSVDPTSSVGCPGGNSLLFSEGEQLNFYNYNPSFGWKFDHWIGTYASNSDVAFMPASKHKVTAVYTEKGVPPQGKAVLDTPKGAIFKQSPTYNWIEVADATWYLLVVKKDGTQVVTWLWKSATSICSGGTCTVTPGKLLGAGNYTWWVMGKNDAGNGPWSLPGNFTIEGKPDRPALYAPKLTITDQTPAYSWEDVYSAEFYLLVVKKDGTEVVTWLWKNASDICSGGTCVVDPGKKLGAGSYTFWVLAKNSYGDGFWSVPNSYTLEGTPDQPDLYGPSGMITNNNPKFTWEDVYSATHYVLVVRDSSNNVEEWTTYNAADICSAGNCGVVPSGLALPNDSYTWQVLPKNGYGNGFWSLIESFTVKTP